MRILALLLTLIVPVWSSADSWSFPPEVASTEYTFGSTKVVRVSDARKDQTYPDFRIDVYTDGERVGRYSGQSFDHIAASENNRIFVAVSNRGLPRTAIIAFDAKGQLRALVDHSVHVERFDYCNVSVTLVREWYDADNPSLQVVQTDEGVEIWIRSCRGQILNISELLE